MKEVEKYREENADMKREPKDLKKENVEIA